MLAIARARKAAGSAAIAAGSGHSGARVKLEPLEAAGDAWAAWDDGDRHAMHQ
jgi:hypothetical protein